LLVIVPDASDETHVVFDPPEKSATSLSVPSVSVVSVAMQFVTLPEPFVSRIP
jgi:hypothetical protein